MKKINNDIKYLISIWSILILAILLTYAHHGYLLIDCGREVYYPTQIILGKILYKDIFNIYGPFSYMFNAALFKFFGINLNVLYLSGSICAFLISSLIYLISKRFLSSFLSFAISVFTISVGVLNLSLFNFIFPYSYGMLYGLTAILISIWLLLKYETESEKFLYFYFSCFFAGLSITSKYEFLPYLLVLLYAALKIKSLNLKQYYFSIFSLIFMPVFCFGILFLQGLNINDLASTVLTIRKMMQTQTLKYFYTSQGIYFSKNALSGYIKNFLTTLIPLGFFIWGCRLQNKFLSAATVLISIFLIFHFINPASFMIFPLFILILAILNYKNIANNKALIILTFSAITISIKVFWGLAILNYGVFFVSFLAIAFFALFFKTLKTKNINENIVGIYFIIVSFIIGWQNLSELRYKNYPVKSSKGTIYTYSDIGSSTNNLINYINKNAKNNDTIVVFPEGPLINFFTNRKSDNYYNSLIPLYIETFGEDKLIQHFEKTKPEYIIFNNWNTKEYYFKYICTDYALSFCSFVAKNYTQVKLIDNGFRYLIYKKHNY